MIALDPQKRHARIPGALFTRMADDKLTLAQRSVLTAILLCLNWRRGEAFPKNSTLATLAGLSEETVSTCRARLVELGYFKEDWRPVKGGGKFLRATFDKDGNPLLKAGGLAADLPAKLGQTFRPNRVNVPGLTSSNFPVKAGTLPTSGGQELGSEQSQEQSQEQRERRAPDAFVPPTVNDVTTYCLEAGLVVSPELYVNHRQARGWAGITDWRADVRVWAARERSFAPLGAQAFSSPKAPEAPWACELCGRRDQQRGAGPWCKPCDEAERLAPPLPSAKEMMRAQRNSLMGA